MLTQSLSNRHPWLMQCLPWVEEDSGKYFIHTLKVPLVYHLKYGGLEMMNYQWLTQGPTMKTLGNFLVCLENWWWSFQTFQSPRECQTSLSVPSPRLQSLPGLGQTHSICPFYFIAGVFNFVLRSARLRIVEILLLQHPKSWDYRHHTLCLACWRSFQTNSRHHEISSIWSLAWLSVLTDFL